jgi:hypothetical protein
MVTGEKKNGNFRSTVLARYTKMMYPSFLTFSLSSYLYELTLFHLRRRVLLQRDILAELLSRKLELRHPDSRKALAALESFLQ